MLANISIFSDLDVVALDALGDITSIRHLKSGERLCRKGDPGNQLYSVIQGRLKISAASPDGKEVVFHISDPGDVIGDIALLDGKPRSATVVALEPCELMTLDRKDFFPFLERHPRVAIHLAQVLAARVRRLSDTAEDAMLMTLPSRLAKTLVQLSRRFGRKTPDGLFVDLKLPQSDLADMLGTSRESVNKQIRDWVVKELILWKRQRVTICDLEQLESIAQFSVE